jgi:serine/threonine protein kinase
MDRERWAQVKQIVYDCLQLAPGSREAHLAAACGSDTALLSEVRTLLDSHQKADDFMETPVLGGDQEESFSGRQLGHYQVLETVAEGGMGAVYRAVRVSDFQKQVAIKLVKRGMDTDAILQRFRRERQILSGLDHPNIARLLDGGAAPDGRPYLVMEFIEGIPITDYADLHRLGIPERLEMFRTVCAAVQYAHQNLIVHRDLKPSNILVTNTGEPKLLDFGIAKLLEPENDSTMTSQRLMTPEFASPEQACGLPVTTATDIYSLGVLLYMLLTGEHPFRFATRTPEEIVRVVSETEPRKPSAVRPVSRDLDNIVLKAIHKDPARRYVSAEQLSEDIRRYLAGMPILARKDTLAYRASKFIRRHTTSSVLAALVVLSLVVGMAATLWQSRRLAIQQQITGAVNDFLLNDVLSQASSNKQARPDVKPNPDLKVRTALDRAAAYIQGKFVAQPLVEASIRQTIGAAYEDLGLYREAQSHIERAVELRRRELGPQDPVTLASMDSLAELLENQDQYKEAEAIRTKVVALRRTVLGERNPETLSSMAGLATLYKLRGHLPEASALHLKVLDLRRRTLGERNLDTAESMNDLANVYSDQGKLAEAEPLYVKALEIRRTILGDEHPNTLSTETNLAFLYSLEGFYSKAEALDSKVLEVRRRVLGVDHSFTLGSMNNLAADYVSQGKYDLAEPLLKEVSDARIRVQGAKNPNTLISINNLAVFYRRRGKYADAEPLSLRVMQGLTEALGPNHPFTLNSENNLAMLYQAQGKYEQADALYLKALNGRRQVLGEEHPDTLATLRNLARLSIKRADYVRAESWANTALAIVEKNGSRGWERSYAQSQLGECLSGQKKYSAAEPLLLAGYEGLVRSAIPVAERSVLDETGLWIIQLYHDWKKPAKAAEWTRKLGAGKSGAALP